MLVLTFVGQTTASTMMSCEIKMNHSIEQTKIMVSAMESVEHNMNKNHDCCDEEIVISSDKQCGDNCQCLIAGCSAMFIPNLTKLSGNITPLDQSQVLQRFELRSQYLSFLYRPPISS